MLGTRTLNGYKELVGAHSIVVRGEGRDKKGTVKRQLWMSDGPSTLFPIFESSCHPAGLRPSKKPYYL